MIDEIEFIEGEQKEYTCEHKFTERLVAVLKQLPERFYEKKIELNLSTFQEQIEELLDNVGSEIPAVRFREISMIEEDVDINLVSFTKLMKITDSLILHYVDFIGSIEEDNSEPPMARKLSLLMTKIPFGMLAKSNVFCNLTWLELNHSLLFSEYGLNMHEKQLIVAKALKNLETLTLENSEDEEIRENLECFRDIFKNLKHLELYYSNS